jgi:hypothetical protein
VVAAAEPAVDARSKHHLIDILDFLDPDFERFPEHRRRKIDDPLQRTGEGSLL